VPIRPDHRTSGHRPLIDRFDPIVVRPCRGRVFPAWSPRGHDPQPVIRSWPDLRTRIRPRATVWWPDGDGASQSA